MEKTEDYNVKEKYKKGYGLTTCTYKNLAA